MVQGNTGRLEGAAQVTDEHLADRPADSQVPFFFHSYGQTHSGTAGSRAPDNRQEQFHDLQLMGLRGLMEAGRWRVYRRAVWRIAERIVDVATAARFKPCDVSLFDDLRNVFAPCTQGDS